MGKLVDLTKKVRRVRPRTDLATAGGEVLIFTGVRYQRDEAGSVPEKPAGAPTNGSKRRRG